MTVTVKVCIEDARGGVSLKRDVEITPDSKPEEVYAKLLQPFAMLADQVASTYAQDRKENKPQPEIVQVEKLGLNLHIALENWFEVYTMSNSGNLVDFDFEKKFGAVSEQLQTAYSAVKDSKK